MKNKAPLALMEQLIMLLIFALAAALCLQIFALSGKISRRCEAMGHAVTTVQNVAETMKAYQGDLSQHFSLLTDSEENSPARISYDADWEEVSPEQAVYHILVTSKNSSVPGLGQAEISARTTQNDELFCITVCWQEGIYE